NSLTGNVPPEVEEQVVVNTLAGLVRGGVASLAFEWLDERMTAQPDRLFYYHLKFQLFESMGRLADAAAVADAWQQQTGNRDPGMDEGLVQMRRRLQNQPSGE
ncbi:hypothetical protein CSB20_02580, partial [bacterium DOLZORAL124_64_63]